MIDLIGDRRKQLLRLLLKRKSGMTVDELSKGLGIARNAVRQHLSALSSEGLVGPGQARPTGGRPEQLYLLTEKGMEIFPRQYSWLAHLVMEALRQEHGPDGLGERLAELGRAVGQSLRRQQPALETVDQRVEALAQTLDQLGYSAARTPRGDGEPTIEADNCVFHALAVQHPEVCRLDLAMLEAFTDQRVDHEECLARGGNVCRFKFLPKG